MWNKNDGIICSFSFIYQIKTAESIIENTLVTIIFSMNQKVSPLFFSVFKYILTSSGKYEACCTVVTTLWRLSITCLSYSPCGARALPVLHLIAYLLCLWSPMPAPVSAYALGSDSKQNDTRCFVLFCFVFLNCYWAGLITSLNPSLFGLNAFIKQRICQKKHQKKCVKMDKTQLNEGV